MLRGAIRALKSILLDVDNRQVPGCGAKKVRREGLG